jgi:hypothetical protein
MEHRYMDYNDLIEETISILPDIFISILNYVKNNNFIIRESTLIKILEKNGMLLEYIDISMQTFNIAYAAVSQNGHAYQYVNPEFKNIESMKTFNNINTIMPNSIELQALMTSGSTLQYMPDLSNNITIAEIAVNSDGTAIQYLSEELLTSYTINNIFNTATLNNPYAIQYIKRSYFTNDNDYYQVALNSIKKRGELIEYVENPNIELCMEAIKNNECAILKIPTSISGNILIPISTSEPIINLNQNNIEL